MKSLSAALAIFGTLSLVLATDGSIDDQIEKIQKAPAKERVRLMNEFKLRLASMNEKERSEALSKLRSQAQATKQTQSKEKDKLQNEGEQSRISQMNENQQLQQTQMKNQQQAGDQFAKEYKNSAAAKPIEIQSQKPAPSPSAPGSQGAGQAPIH